VRMKLLTVMSSTFAGVAALGPSGPPSGAGAAPIDVGGGATASTGFIESASFGCV